MYFKESITYPILDCDGKINREVQMQEHVSAIQFPFKTALYQGDGSFINLRKMFIGRCAACMPVLF